MKKRVPSGCSCPKIPFYQPKDRPFVGQCACLMGEEDGRRRRRGAEEGTERSCRKRRGDGVHNSTTKQASKAATHLGANRLWLGANPSSIHFALLFLLPIPIRPSLLPSSCLSSVSFPSEMDPSAG